MNSNALAKDLAVLKKDLHEVSDKISAAHEELKAIDRQRELARADLRNIQTMKDPLMANYELREKQKKKELVLLEADIVAAIKTKEDIDEATAERLETGRKAVENVLKVERTTEDSIKNLKHKEESMLHHLSNVKADQDRETSALVQVQQEVVTLKEEHDKLLTVLLSERDLKAKQDYLDKQYKALNEGRDYLQDWEKTLVRYERDLNVMEKRLKPEYIAIYKSINSKYVNAEDIKAHTRRISIQDKVRGINP